MTYFKNKENIRNETKLFDFVSPEKNDRKTPIKSTESGDKSVGMDTIDQDPFEDLSDDIMMGVLDLIDARTLELVD